MKRVTSLRRMEIHWPRFTVRFRPMLLTALAVVVGASVILADPIFQGLAISLMFGEIASLLISRMAVPVLYFMANRDKSGR